MNVLVVDDEKDMETLFQQRFRKEMREKKIDFFFASSGGRSALLSREAQS